jgi:hypothetical protein
LIRIRNGQIISLEVAQPLKNKLSRLFTIKDSFKLLPAALGKLAKDFKLEEGKDHFPHYFLLNTLEETMAYEGAVPTYEYFEAKRTSLKDWEALSAQYGEKWNFMEQARKYLLLDCQVLHQVLVAFFTELNTNFQVNPIRNLSIPGVAFKVWKQHQLPILIRFEIETIENLKVHDLSHSLDTHFRAAYHGGIVDVYRPHLEGGGYYYDVNSLYPTAMCRLMPVGEPRLVTLTASAFEAGDFFGYLWARVRAPSLDTAAGYIGLLPLKLGGRLVCPGGTFEGACSSNECFNLLLGNFPS